MLRIQFTKTKLDALRAGAKRVRYTDERTPHLALYVTANGQKAFYYYRKLRGSLLEIRLGLLAEMNIAMARERVEEITGRIVMGLPPIEIEAVKVKPLTFGGLFEHYMVHHGRPNTKTWKADESRFKNSLSEWADVPMAEVTADMVTVKVTEVRARAPHSANRLLELIKRLYN